MEILFDDILQIGYVVSFMKVSSFVPIYVTVILMNGTITTIKLAQKIRTYRKKVKVVKRAMRFKGDKKFSP